MATYVEIDDADRRYFEDSLSNDTERLAFINYFTHVERDFPRNKRTSRLQIVRCYTDSSQDPALATVASRLGRRHRAHTGYVVQTQPHLSPPSSARTNLRQQHRLLLRQALVRNVLERTPKMSVNWHWWSLQRNAAFPA